MESESSFICEETEKEPTSSKQKKAFNRQHQGFYLKHGFIATGDSHRPSPRCQSAAADSLMRKCSLQNCIQQMWNRWFLFCIYFSVFYIYSGGREDVHRDFDVTLMLCCWRNVTRKLLIKLHTRTQWSHD